MSEAVTGDESEFEPWAEVGVEEMKWFSIVVVFKEKKTERMPK